MQKSLESLRIFLTTEFKFQSSVILFMYGNRGNKRQDRSEYEIFFLIFPEVHP